jgi:hypothetical protein
MMDLFRNWFKSAAGKRQEQVSAYVDGQLSAQERQRLERELAVDAALRQEVEQQRLIKSRLQQLTRQRAPRNFTLNPSLYGRPQPQPATWLYPTMRTATALAALFFVMAIILEMAALFVIRPATAPVAMESAPVAQTPAARMFATPEVELQVEMAVEAAGAEMEEGESLPFEADMAEQALTADDAPPPEAPPGPGLALRLEVTGTAPAAAIPTPVIEPPLEADRVEPPADHVVPFGPPEAEAKLLSEPVAPFTPWRMVQGALGAAVFILALITLYLRRRTG